MTVLAVDDVAVFYGAVEALRGVSLHVKESETVAVLGANGAGKSTLLRTVSGIHRPRRGAIRLLGQRIDTLPPHKIAAMGISHVPEGRNVFGGLSVEENLVVGAYRLRRQRKTRALMDEVFDLFPRLAERRRQDASLLSGGEQQMLALARALMGQPQLLMLDEPSLGLAPIVVNRVFAAIAQMRARGLTIVLVEQNASLALQYCDRAYVLSLGEITATGTGAQLLEDPTVQSAYLGASTGPPPDSVDVEQSVDQPVPVRRFRVR